MATACSRLLASLGWPTLLLALAAGRWPEAPPSVALLLLAAAGAYYLVSVRAMLSLSLRYLLPMTVIFAMSAGVALGRLAAAGPAAGRGSPWSRGPGLDLRVRLDVNRMMAGDGRYGAEAWLAESAAPGADVEIYQHRTYLPRFAGNLKVHEVDYEQRDAASFAARNPTSSCCRRAGCPA